MPKSLHRCQHCDPVIEAKEVFRILPRFDTKIPHQRYLKAFAQVEANSEELSSQLAKYDKLKPFIANGDDFISNGHDRCSKCEILIGEGHIETYMVGDVCSHCAARMGRVKQLEYVG